MFAFRTVAPLLVGILAVLVSACQQKQPAAHGAAAPASVSEATLRPLPLGAPLHADDMEISGLAWRGDTLVVLPQYPSRHAPAGGFQVYGIPRAALEAALASEAPAPLSATPLPIQPVGLGRQRPEYEGCEAIAFANGTMYLLVEARREAAMHGYMVTGRVQSRDTLVVDVTRHREIPSQASLRNMAYEALTVSRDTVLAFFEANGANVNARPQVHRFIRDAEPLNPAPFPTLEYRLTDATAMDASGRFWVMNYFFPGERDVLDPAADSLRMVHGIGATHNASDVVERLVELRYTGSGVVRTSTPPLWLALEEGEARNWEGIVRFGDGFLIATDRHPRTMLAYVERPDA